MYLCSIISLSIPLDPNVTIQKWRSVKNCMLLSCSSHEITPSSGLEPNKCSIIRTLDGHGFQKAETSNILRMEKYLKYKTLPPMQSFRRFARVSYVRFTYRNRTKIAQRYKKSMNPLWTTFVLNFGASNAFSNYWTLLLLTHHFTPLWLLGTVLASCEN